jgi:pyruvate formate lyase activating enzyme
MSPGDIGLCGVRANRQGQLVSLVYGRPVAHGVEPIEKKPLYHFYPGHATLSLGTAGCNLRCTFCENWEISKVTHAGRIPAGPWLPPDQVVASAQASRCRSICFTYTEPVVSAEYVLDVAQIARSCGLNVVLLTSGYVTDQVLDLLMPWIDAVKLDLKAPDEHTYRRLTGAALGPVLEAMAALTDHGVWMEVSTVLLPGINDTAQALWSLATCILDVAGPDTPWHLMRFFPSYRLVTQVPSDLRVLMQARQTALGHGLHYVYLSNIGDYGVRYTDCPNCGARLIDRGAHEGVYISLQSGACYNCGSAVAGRGFQKEGGLT